MSDVLLRSTAYICRIFSSGLKFAEEKIQKAFLATGLGHESRGFNCLVSSFWYLFS